MLLKIKNILGVFLVLSIVMAGFPAQAKLPCPMAAKMQMQQMSDMQGMSKGMPCKHCADMVKQAQQQDKCSSDFLCKAKCAAMNGGATAFHLPVASFFSLVKTTEKLTMMDSALSFGVFSSQDRPPKYLS